MRKVKGILHGNGFGGSGCHLPGEENLSVINKKMPVIKYDQLYSCGRIIFKDYLLKKKHKVMLYDGIWSCDCKNKNCKQIIKGKKNEESIRNKREIGISLAIKALS